MGRGEFPNLTDAKFESVRQMVGIFGGYTLRSLVATPADQVKRIETLTRSIALVPGLQTPMTELKAAQHNPLRLQVNLYEEKEGENPTSGPQK
ncbi:Gag protein [Phytophthora palmivora]|uniref:Gag protein n=1 Tax=Phytophthora palmivora TaxID=4796 RepID=A0A2P4XAV3_9STRA|nr:Gag protein [Phytophthora palmivora]